jgi:phage terminase small subunit
LGDRASRKKFLVINARQQRFVDEYCIDLDGKRAALAAGYVGGNLNYPHEAANRLLRSPVVRAAIARRKEGQLQRAELSASTVLDQLRALSMIDMRDFFDDDGVLKPPSRWSVDMGRAVVSFDTVKKNVTTGDGKSDDVFRVRLADKVRSLEMLAKHFGLLVDRVDHSGAVVFVHEQLETPATVEHAAVPATALPEAK